MQLGIFAKTFSGQAPDPVLAAVAKAGFHAAHYNWACSGLSAMPDEIQAGVAEAVEAAAQEHHVAIVGLSATWNMAHPNPEIRKQGLNRLNVMAGKARIVGTRLVTLCTGTRDADDQWRYHPDNSSADAWSDMLLSMRTAVEIAETHDLLLGIEPELANVICDIPAAKRLFSEIGSSRLKLVLDPANLFEVASPTERYRLVDEAIAAFAPAIAMAHAKDRKADGEFTAAGQGVIDFDHFVQSLHECGFTGPIVTHGLSAEEAPGVASFLAGLLTKHGCLSS